VVDNARRKLIDKALDLIAANAVGEQQGFDVSDNTLQVLWSDGQATLGPAPKTQIASELIELIGARLDATG
jgi:phosphopantothenoylcysteine decarboxylase/phosphopantothenate--cysteine ligase